MSRTECSFIISQIRVRHESLQGGSITGVSISDVSFIVSGAAEADIEQEKGFGKGIR